MADLVEDFEDSSYAFAITGDWELTTELAKNGAGCLRSKRIGDGGTTEAQVTVPAGATKVRFWYRVSSEATYDLFWFFNNSTTESLKLSGEVGWTLSSDYNVTPGTMLTFRYTKDGSNGPNLDAAFIDDLTFVFPDSRPLAQQARSAAALTRASRW
ncbi:hypothetical protein ACWCSD_36365 [Nonomuraea sp. NPDC001684]